MTDELHIYRTPSQSRPRAMTSPNMVRSYRESPDTVALQLRLNGSIVHVSLQLSEARKLGEFLAAASEPYSNSTPGV